MRLLLDESIGEPRAREDADVREPESHLQANEQCDAEHDERTQRLQRSSSTRPRYRDSPTSSSSMRSRRLNFATRSERQSDPVLIWPAPVPTARSAIVVSSVSPERCEITVLNPASRAIRIASNVSVNVPIWFNLI